MRFEKAIYINGRGKVRFSFERLMGRSVETFRISTSLYPSPQFDMVRKGWKFEIATNQRYNLNAFNPWILEYEQWLADAIAEIAA